MAEDSFEEAAQNSSNPLHQTVDPAEDQPIEMGIPATPTDVTQEMIKEMNRGGSSLDPYDQQERLLQPDDSKADRGASARVQSGVPNVPADAALYSKPF